MRSQVLHRAAQDKCITCPDSKSAAGATGREGRAAALGTAGKGTTTAAATLDTAGKGATKATTAAAAAAAADVNASRTCHEDKCCSNRQVAFPKIQVSNFCLLMLPLNMTGKIST